MKKVLVKRFNTEQYALKIKFLYRKRRGELRYEWFEELIIDNGQSEK